MRDYTQEEEVHAEMVADGVFDAEKYTTNPDLDFKDIRNEEYRTYIFPPTFEGGPHNTITVNQPEAVSFKAPSRTWVGGGSHRVVDKNGKSFYIPSGWIGMEWEKDGQPGKVAYEW